MLLEKSRCLWGTSKSGKVRSLPIVWYDLQGTEGFSWRQPNLLSSCSNRDDCLTLTSFSSGNLTQMASPSFSVEEVTNHLREYGFFSIHDAEIGARITEMEQKRYQFSPSTTPGLEFYRQTVLGDSVSAHLTFPEGLLTVSAHSSDFRNMFRLVRDRRLPPDSRGSRSRLSIEKRRPVC